MSYKGRDLDLRPLCAAWRRRGCRRAGGLVVAAGVGRAGPMPVDPTVLACCAGAGCRRASTLRAKSWSSMGRSQPASVRLRRQSLPRCRRPGARGAAQVPELENVLRRAAGRAGQDSVPASVHDLMRAVLSYGREASATALLLRCANDPQQLERWAARIAAPRTTPWRRCSRRSPRSCSGVSRMWRARCAPLRPKSRPIARRCSTSWARSSMSCGPRARTASPHSRPSFSTRSRTSADR